MGIQAISEATGGVVETLAEGVCLHVDGDTDVVTAQAVE